MSPLNPEMLALGRTHPELWQAVRDEISSLIITGEYSPGERLPLTKLAARFDVSRGTVHTALAELVSAGLVVATPRRGMQVATFERTDIDELLDATLALERTGVRWAAERASDADIALLRELLSDFDHAEQHQVDRPSRVAAELEFHRELMRVSGNRPLLQLWTQLSERIRFVISVVQRALPQYNWAPYDRSVLDAIEVGDADLAEAELVRCFGTAQAELSSISADTFEMLMGRGRAAAAR